MNASVHAALNRDWKKTIALVVARLRAGLTSTPDRGKGATQSGAASVLEFAMESEPLARGFAAVIARGRRCGIDFSP
jgi:hypothetical protein